ncbi:neuronal acetylcholine receptor subunit alpha-6-like [Patella vulgata]|uniref:neuronal acetylcholine receptor subunit alpha-6-like n=1 Tax=Patella vulgata TaxID=6465 RepID=UPI00218097C5|nr:neuronal acetylcholine receptor subunit alpha-6-like [Patella vulgata]
MVHCGLTFLLLFCWGQTAHSKTSDNLRTLQKILFSNYSAAIRPQYNQSEPTIVGLKLFVSDLIEVNEVQQFITLSCFFNISWTDEFLQWKPEHYGGIQKMQVESTNIWKPYLDLYSSLDDTDVFGDERYRIFVFHDGRISWHPTKTLRVACLMNVERFPFDVQECNLTFSPLQYTFEEVQLEARDFLSIFSVFKRHGEWEAVNSSVNVFSHTFDGNKLSILRTSLRYKRQHMFFVLNFMVPIIMLSILNLLTFWLPNDSGEKTSFSITVLLALTVFLTTVSSNLPRTSSNTIYITTYITCLLLLSGLTVLATISMLHFHHRNKDMSERNEDRVVDLNAKRITGCQRPKAAWRSKCGNNGLKIDVLMFLIFFLGWCTATFWFFAYVRVPT